MKSTSSINKISTNKRIWGMAGAAMTLAIPFFIMINNNHIEHDQSLCPFKMLTGFPCPGCGITKSIIFFYKGDFIKSFKYHLFGPFVVVFCAVSILVLGLELFTDKSYFRNLFYSKTIAYCLGIALFSYHLIRLVYFVSQNSVATILSESIWR